MRYLMFFTYHITLTHTYCCCQALLPILLLDKAMEKTIQFGKATINAIFWTSSTHDLVPWHTIQGHVIRLPAFFLIFRTGILLWTTRCKGCQFLSQALLHMVFPFRTQSR